MTSNEERQRILTIPENEREKFFNNYLESKIESKTMKENKRDNHKSWMDLSTEDFMGLICGYIKNWSD